MVIPIDHKQYFASYNYLSIYSMENMLKVVDTKTVLFYPKLVFYTNALFPNPLWTLSAWKDLRGRHEGKLAAGKNLSLKERRILIEPLILSPGNMDAMSAKVNKAIWRARIENVLVNNLKPS